jgi:endonuclease I
MISEDRTAGGNEQYEELRKSHHLTEILEKYRKAFPERELEIDRSDIVLYMNEYGKRFAAAYL